MKPIRMLSLLPYLACLAVGTSFGFVFHAWAYAGALKEAESFAYRKGLQAGYAKGAELHRPPAREQDNVDTASDTGSSAA